jgi:ArsR family transcriptional regulator
MDLIPQDLLEPASRRFKMLGEPVRLDLLNHLHTKGESSVQQVVDATGHQQANVSKQLGAMARENLLGRRKEGLYVYYRIIDPTLSALCTLVCGQIRQELFAVREQQRAGG